MLCLLYIPILSNILSSCPKETKEMTNLGMQFQCSIHVCLQRMQFFWNLNDFKQTRSQTKNQMTVSTCIKKHIKLANSINAHLQ